MIYFAVYYFDKRKTILLLRKKILPRGAFVFSCGVSFFCCSVLVLLRGGLFSYCGALVRSVFSLYL